MLKFLFKGLIRDKSRSLFPVIIVSAGVALSVFFVSFMLGYINNMVDSNAKYSTGHVKLLTKAYNDELSLKPLDSSLLNVGSILTQCKKDYPDISWLSRIYFGGLLDIPKNDGSTDQGQVACIGVDLFKSNKEIEYLNLKKGLVSGKIPQKSGEIIISNKLFNKMKLSLGDKIVLISSTIYGSMAIKSFNVSGTVNFGIVALDRGYIVTDISDARSMLDMEDGASEILGFFRDFNYSQSRAEALVKDFNSKFLDEKDEFSPMLITLGDQNGLKDLISVASKMFFVMIAMFIGILFIVLWNSGLMNGIRRYGEIGVRLAIGESKSNVYFSMIIESAIIGIIGSLIGTVIGLAVSYYFQYKGIDMSAYNKDATIAMTGMLYTKVTPNSYFVGFIPGIIATVAGALVSGVGIFRRRTSQLFKELET